jgi:hypothetical protein
MHGMIFTALKKFCRARLGPSAWETVLEHSEMANRVFLTLESYSDEDALALIATVCRLTDTETSVVLEDFGEFLAPELIALYAPLVRPEWRTFDLLLNTENTIHRVVRLRNPGAEPPRIRCDANGPDQVTILYDSPRRLCSLARGLIRGVGRHYDETIAISESSCMLRGDPACELVVCRQ